MQTNYTMYTLLVGMWNGTFIFKRLAFSFTVNLYLPWAYDSNCAPGHLFQKYKNRFTQKPLHVFTVIANNWKLLRCPSIGD